MEENKNIEIEDIKKRIADLNKKVADLEHDDEEESGIDVTNVVNTVIRCGTKLAIAWLIFGRGGTAEINIPFFHIRKED